MTSADDFGTEQREGPAMTTTPPSAPAGWYPDPGAGGGQRYWDGTGWTGQTRAAQPAGPVDQPRHGGGKRSPLVVAAIVATVLALIVAGWVVFHQVSRSTHSLNIAKYPVSLAVDPDTHTVYVTHSNETVSVIDGRTRKLTATVHIGEGPGGVAVDPGTRTVYVANGDRVSVIAGSTNTVTATVPIGKDPGGVAVDPGTHTVYVANYDPGNGRGGVSAVDGATRAVTATVSVGAPGDAVAELAVDPGTHTVYVPNRFDGTVWVIDGSTNTVTATVPVNGPREEGSGSDISSVVLGGGPEGVAVDPGSHAVYVTHSGPDNNVGMVLKIDGSTRAVTASADAGYNPTAVAVDPGLHTVYTISADSHMGWGTLWVIEFQ